MYIDEKKIRKLICILDVYLEKYSGHMKNVWPSGKTLCLAQTQYHLLPLEHPPHSEACCSLAATGKLVRIKGMMTLRDLRVGRRFTMTESIPLIQQWS